MDDNEDCERHEDDIRALRGLVHELEQGLASVKLTLEVKSHDTDSAFASLGQEVWRATERIPERFLERFQKLEIEHEQIARIVYGFVVLVLVAVATGLIALVVRK